MLKVNIFVNLIQKGQFEMCELVKNVKKERLEEELNLKIFFLFFIVGIRIWKFYF